MGRSAKFLSTLKLLPDLLTPVSLNDVKLIDEKIFNKSNNLKIEIPTANIKIRLAKPETYNLSSILLETISFDMKNIDNNIIILTTSLKIVRYNLLDKRKEITSISESRIINK
jgi:hypothetical protein